MPPVGFEPKISAGERPQAVCRVLSGRGLCDELITRPEESYRLCCVAVCDLETSRMGVPYIYIYIYIYDISSLRIKCRQLFNDAVNTYDIMSVIDE